MRKRSTILALAVLFTVQLFAQTTRTVTGTVADDKGSPLAGATIKAVGSGGKVIAAAIADVTGKFSIQVTDKTKGLQVSYVGLEEKFVPLTADLSNVVVKLSTPSGNLAEVVVVGYGAARKATEVPGSIVTVKASTIQDKPTANMLDELQGKVAGLQIYSSSGEPSNTPSIRLNGVGSLSASSTPLFIMDGVPIDQGTILSLNPEDFESITVLRDASATSIYGSRAANGVIIFTSKKGKLNTSTITLNSEYGISNLTNNTLKLFNSFMNTQQFTDFLVSSGQRTQSQVDATLANYHADTKWYTVYFQPNRPTYSADLNISGGGGKTTYYVSGGYFDQDGLAWRSGYKRYTVRANLNTTVNNWFQMGLTTFGGYDERQTNQYGTNNLNRGLSQLIPPYYSNKDSNGVEYSTQMPGINLYNPKYLATELPGISNNLQLNPTGYIQINPIKELTIKSTAGIEFYDYRTTSHRLPSYIGSLNNGSTTESFSRSTTKTITNTAEYRLSVATHHNITLLAGQEFINSTATGFTSSSSGQTDDRLILLTNGTSSITATSSETQYAYLSYFGRLSYNFDRKYFLDLSIRNDQSSRFGRNLRGATFYSVGGSWNAKKEDFLGDINWLDELVVKASVGTSGNSAIGNYDNLATVGSSAATAYNGSTGWYISAAGNADLSWEQQRQINVGIQATIFKKLHIDAEYFDRLTTNMLMSVPYPFTSGFSSVESNVGGLKNTGVNANISYDAITTKNGYLTLYANMGYVKQEVTSLFQGKQYWIIPNTGVSYAIGQPVSYFYPIFAEIDPASGQPLWYVPNSDPDKIVYTNKDPKNVTSNFNSTSLQQNIGIKRYAPLNGGFGLNGGYRGFYVAADFTFSQGKYMINNDEYFFNNPTQFSGYNQVVDVMDYWKKPGDVTRYPKYGTQFTQFDSRLVENASFIRLKNLTVGYSLPKDLLRKTKTISAVKIYVAFRNIWTLTKYPGPDPEIDTNVTLGADPNTTQTAFGLSIQF